jgi:hypothetical protein
MLSLPPAPPSSSLLLPLLPMRMLSPVSPVALMAPVPGLSSRCWGRLNVTVERISSMPLPAPP